MIFYGRDHRSERPEIAPERRQLRRVPRVLASSSVRSADRIYVLHEGQIVEHGTHDELMQLDGRYAELFTMQASAYFPELMKVQAQ